MMKKFKKISAVLGGVLLAGMTFGTAAAASFPAPFVQSGVADVAIVYGTGAGVSSLDQVYAGNIQSTLGESVDGNTVISVDGGESFMLDKSSNHFNFNNALNSVYSTLDGDEMDFLADGTYNDGDVDETYSQKITPGTKTLSLFADTDYMDKDPTVGFKWTNGETILSYELDLDDDVLLADMVGTDMPLMGGSYYVLAASSTQIDVLDSAEKTTITEGESLTIGGKTVSIYSIDANGVRFTVDGTNVDKLTSNGDYEEIGNTNAYIVLDSWTYDTRDGRDSMAEFSIGAGKIELISGEEAELNTEDIDGLNVAITTGTNASYLDIVNITWKSDGETFLGEGDSITMPGFETISLAFGGLTMPSDSETISINNGDTLTLNMGNYDLPIAWFDGTNTTAAGEEDYLLKLATEDLTYAEMGYSSTDTVWWNSMYINGTADAQGSTEVNTTTSISTAALNLSENERFLATRVDTDLTDVETLYYEVKNIDIDDSSTWTVELEDLIGDNDLTFTNDIDDTDDHGDVTVTIVGFSDDNSSALFEFTPASGSMSYNKAVSETGLIVTLTDVASIGANGVGSGTLTFQEADKDDDLAEGASWTATFKTTTNNRLHVSTHNLTAYDEEETDEHYIGYVPSDLASMFEFDTNADEYDYSITYYGGEVTADVQVVAGGDVSSSSSGLGDVLVMDSEVDSVKAKNLIIVGGSCINSAAATVLGVPARTCGDAFTAATGVGSGQFLIQSVGDAYTNGKVAVVVAGYDVTDTNNAATYLRTQTVDTMAGKKYIGTSATEATLSVN